MSREIDERIVAMYFDNKSFESGAQQTLKTLEELKQSCNMEGVGKGLEAFSDVTKKMNLDDLRKKTDKVKSSFESLGGVMKKVFNAALSPIRAIKNEIDTLNGYIGKVFGIDLASKIVGSLENIFRSLTVAPISAGWNQYENTMDSVKTIMSSTGESIETVKGKLAEMTEYANQTIYSLNDMTSNLGKFTNNGVKLDDATNAMIGLANATADAGQGAQQASMAMYNVSQAIGVGKMTTIDWKSLENANIATKKLKQTFIDAAVAHGTLTKKIEKDKKSGEEIVKYYTKAEKGSKEMEVSVENFRETLNKGWLDKASMMNTFAIFSGQLTADEIAALGFSKEESARLYQIGQEAMAAATEVRTFSKMMDALRESVQSGWASSFEYIFGDMQEGTNLWTMINDKIDGILSKSTENRNNILLSWRGLMKDEDGQIRKIRDVYLNRKEALMLDYDAGRISAERYAEELTKLEETLGNKKLWVDYREIAIETFNNIFDVIGSISGAVKGAWTDVFGEFNADTLKNITQGVREFVDKVKKWLGDADDASSRISKIRKALSGVFSVIKIGLNLVKSLIEIGWNVVKPFIDPLLDLFSKFGEWLNLGEAKNLGDMIRNLTDKFKSFWKTLTNLGWKGALEKIGDWFSGIVENIKEGIRTWLLDNGLGGVVEWFESVGAKIEEGFNIVKRWWSESKIGQFFSEMWESITGLFKREVDPNTGIEMRSPIERFFYSFGANVDSAFNSVKTWWKDSGIPDFFEDLWNSVVGLFEPTGVQHGYVNGRLQSWYEDSPIVSFFKGIGDALTSAWETVSNLPIWDTLGDFFSDLWERVTGMFEPKGVQHGYVNGRLQSWYEDSPIVSFFKGIGDSLTNVWNKVSGLPIWDTLGDFFSDLWNSVTGLFEPKGIQYGYVDGRLQSWYEDSPIVSFFKGIGDALTSAWETVSNLPIWDTLGDFFSDLWERVTGMFEPKGVRHGYVNGRLQSWYEDSPIVAFFKGIGDALTSAWETVSSLPIWDTIGDFFSDLWERVTGMFEPNKEVKHGYKNGKLQSWYEVSDSPIVKFFKDIKDGVESAWNEMTDWEGWKEIGNFFTNIWNQIVGKAGEESENVADEKTVSDSDASAVAEKTGIIQGILNTLSGFWDSISGFVKEIGGGETAERFMSAITKLLEIVATVAEKVINLVHNALVKGDILSCIQLVEAIGGILTIKWIQSRNTKNLATISENATGIGTTMLQMAGAIALISFAVTMIGKVPTGELVQGVVSVVLIATALFFVTKQLTKLSQANDGDEPTKAWERVLSKLVMIGGAALMLDTLVKGLPAIIDAISKAKEFSGLSGDDIMKTLLGAAGVIAGIMLALGVVERIVPGGLSPIAAVKTVIAVVGSIVVAGGLLLGAGGLLEVLGATPEDITNKMARVTAFLEGFGDALNGLLRGLFGITHGEALQQAHAERSQENTKSLLGFLNDLTGGFDTSQLSTLINFMSTITEMTKMSEGFDSSKLVNFSATIEYLVNGLLKFVNLFTGKYTWVDDGNGGFDLEWLDGFTKRGTEEYERLMTAIDIIRQFYDAFSPELLNLRIGQMRNWQTYFSEEGALDTIIENMNAIIDSAGKLHDASGIQFDGIAIVTKFYESISEAFKLSEGSAEVPKFDGTPIVNAIVDSLDIGNVAIKEAVKRMIQSGMDLVEKEGVEFGELSNLLDFTDYFNGSEAEQTTNGIVKTVSENLGGLEGDMNKTVSGLNLKVSGVTIDQSFMENVQKQWEDLQTQMKDGSETDLEITVKPILDTTDFDTQYASFKELFSGNMPVSMGAVIDIGSQPIPIQDTNIINELRNLRFELQNTRDTLQTVLYGVDNDLAMHIDGVTFAVQKIKIPRSNTSLKDIDHGLYQSSVNSSMTGVSTYTDPINAVQD